MKPVEKFSKTNYSGFKPIKRTRNSRRTRRDSKLPERTDEPGYKTPVKRDRSTTSSLRKSAARIPKKRKSSAKKSVEGDQNNPEPRKIAKISAKNFYSSQPANRTPGAAWSAPVSPMTTPIAARLREKASTDRKS